MLSEKQQLLLLELLWKYAHGIKRLERKDVIKKDFLCNDNDFYRNMKKLMAFGYVKNESSSYCLTYIGWCIANIIGTQPNTDKKFRKIAQAIIPVPVWWHELI